jgi:hypothetical protein
MDEPKNELIDAIIREVERVFGEDPGFEGTNEQYGWLATTYGVTEDDDVKWQFLICPDPFDPSKTVDPLDPDNSDDEEMISFLIDDNAVVIAFLETLLAKYRSSDAVWPR